MRVNDAVLGLSGVQCGGHTKLLLCVYVAGCIADDVRHMRNRRGLMPYHIAVHKNFQHLTELLHPDIP